MKNGKLRMENESQITSRHGSKQNHLPSEPGILSTFSFRFSILEVHLFFAWRHQFHTVATGRLVPILADYATIRVCVSTD